MTLRRVFAVVFAALILLFPISAVPASAEEWAVSFRDDFGGAGLPTNGWDVIEGTGYPGGPQNGFGTDEIETMTRSTANIRQDGGFLRITPIRDAGGSWTSGRAETKLDYKPADGAMMRMECKLAMPDVHGAEAAGYWPACWSLGASQRTDRWAWPASGEPDIAESVNGLNRNWSTLHCGYRAQWGGPCGEPTGISNGGVPPASGDMWGGQHVYAYEWDRSGTADVMRWFVDGNLVHTVNESRVPADVWRSMTEHAGYRLILNVAIGGQFPAALGGGPTSATRSGVPMLVDYVQVAFKGGAAPSPTPSVTPSSPPTVTPSSSPTTSPTTCAPTSTPTTTPTPTATPTATEPPATEDPQQSAVIEAENFATQAGTRTVAGAVEVSHADQVGYDVQFGTTRKGSIVTRVSSGVTNGSSVLVEVRLGSATAAPIGSFAVGNTGGWDSYRDIPANIAPTTGKHRVFLTFKGAGDLPVLRVDKFAFGVTPAIRW